MDQQHTSDHPGPRGPRVSITTCNLVPAGTHRGRAVVEGLIAAKRDGQTVRRRCVGSGLHAVQGRDHSPPPGTCGHRADLPGGRPPAGEQAVFREGPAHGRPAVFPHLPEALRDLKSPPRGATETEKLTYEAQFNQRARWRLVRHAGPDTDGVTRWRCPFCAGLLRSRTRIMRNSRRASLVKMGDGITDCCTGTISVVPAELGLNQRIPFGTPAWRISMGPPPSGRVSQCGSQGCLRRPGTRVLQGLRPGENDPPARLHRCGLQPGPGSLISGQACLGRSRRVCTWSNRSSTKSEAPHRNLVAIGGATVTGATGMKCP